MRSFRYLILALLCAVAQRVLATDYNVGTDSELRAAIANDGANIIVTADIDLSNSTLSIASGTTVTINLGGHTLDRQLTQRGEGGGQVITVRSGATLILSNGTLRGGWGGNGGGIANEGGTANLTNVTITGCVGDDRGGGIANGAGGTLTMTGCTITGNISNDKTAPKGGGGIFNAGTLNMQGTNIVNDNWNSKGMRSNLYLKNGTVINITGDLEGSHVYIDMETLGTFTSGYSTYHDIHPAGFFTADKGAIRGMRAVAGEAQLNNAIPEGGVYYIERSWNETAKRVEATYHTLEENQYITLTGSDDDTYLDPGWYAVKGSDVVYDNMLYMNGDGEYHLILCDGASLKAWFFIANSPSVLHIHGQADDTGKMTNMYSPSFSIHRYYAGLGADADKANGTIVIHGGDINVHGGDASPGIGNNSYTDPGGAITIYGGTVHAEGDSEHGSDGGGGGAGIGGGWNNDCGIVNIYGGSVYATGHGNSSGAAGIGSGSYAHNSGTITIYGGYVEATGSYGAAGIGGGQGTNGADVTIHGGTVKAKCDKHEGPGIGAGKNDDNRITYTGTLTVTGGKVYAYGDERGAGIGGGWNTNGSNVTISGGYVYAEGGKWAAGIGSGCEYITGGERHGGTLTVTDGYVEAHGGEDGAGIGGGEDADGGTVNISGGEVRAYGTDKGAGIGGAENGKGGNVTITGGIVIAESGGDQRAIGAGSDSDNHGSLTFADNMGVFITKSLYRSVKENRVIDCRNNKYVRINECAHGGATITDNGSGISVGCDYCYTSTMPYTFKANGNWNDGSNWLSGFMPHEGNDVAVKANATIPADCCANVGNIDMQDGGTITIADGGQLIHSNEGVTATMQKNISKYTVSQTSGETQTDGWYFIALPFSTSYIPNVKILRNDYDIFRLNNTIWENWKKEGDHYHYNLENSRGYLYANSENITLEFTGTVLPSASSKDVSVNAGFNLIGNPFTYNVYADRPYYKMNETHTGIVVVENFQSNPIAPCTGILVNAAEAGTVTFSKEAPALSNNKGSLQMTLSKVKNERGVSTNYVQDNAIVSFSKGSTLPKFRFGDNAEIYIPQDGNDYAIAYSDGIGEMPVYFKATETGKYTITFDGDDMNGVKLIDKFENVTIDLCKDASCGDAACHVRSYTFTASAGDRRDRFVLVLGDANASEKGIFAYQNGNAIIIEGEGELQVFDIVGRMVVTQQINGNATINAPQNGVYVMKLNGKTQKIVIK